MHKLLITGVIALMPSFSQAQFLPEVMSPPAGQAQKKAGHKNSDNATTQNPQPKSEAVIPRKTSYAYSCPCMLMSTWVGGMTELLEQFTTTVTSQNSTQPDQDEIASACTRATTDKNRELLLSDSRTYDFSWARLNYDRGIPPFSGRDHGTGVEKSCTKLH